MLRFLYDISRSRTSLSNGKFPILVHIPKCGGLGITMDLYGYEIGHHRMSYFEDRYGKMAVSKLCRFITVTRDPIERFLSAINYIPESRYAEDQDFYQRKARYFTEGDWVAALEDSEFVEYYHFRPQRWYLDRMDTYDTVLYRAMAIADLYRDLGLPYDAVPQNATKGKDMALSQDQVAALREFYAPDFSLL